MHSAGARAVREDDNEMSREAVLLQWERKIEVAERLAAASQDEDSGELAQPVPLRPADEGEDAEQPRPRTRRFERSAPAEHGAASERTATAAPNTAPASAAPQAVAERRTITITGRPTPAPARRRRAVVDSQLAQPDRIALWAFLLGLLLVAVAAGTAHA
jgi:thiol:disulfide interchange protein